MTLALRMQGWHAVSAHGDFGAARAYTCTMGYVGVVFALFTLGYLLGVWTALLVTKQSQRDYEDGVAVSVSDVPMVVRHRGARRL